MVSIKPDGKTRVLFVFKSAISFLELDMKPYIFFDDRMRIRKPLFVNLSVLVDRENLSRGLLSFILSSKKNVLEVIRLDSMALYKIARIIRREQARSRNIPLVCRNCSYEMDVKFNFAICWQCRIIHPFK